MRSLRRRAPLTCREVAELVTDFLEGALTRTDRIRLERHLSGCDPCVAYIDQIRTAISVSRQVSPGSVDTLRLEQLAALYRSWQESQD